MATTIKGLSEQLAALTDQQIELVSNGERPWSEKREEYDKREEDIKALTAQLTSMRTVNDFNAALGDGPAPVEPKLTGAKSLGRQFVESEVFKNSVPRIGGGQFTTPQAILNAVSPNLAEVGFDEQVTGIKRVLDDVLSVDMLFAPGNTNRGSITYMREVEFVNNADVVAEGGTKPISTVELEKVQGVLEKVAHIIKVSDESLSDIDELMSYINSRLVFGLRQRLEAKLVADLLATPNLGTENYGATPVDEFDAIYFAMSDIRNNTGFEPDAVLMNPLDWRDLRVARDENGQYYGGGPFVGQYGVGGVRAPGLIWDLPVVTSKALTEGTFVVGAFQQGGQLWRKNGIGVDMTNSDVDDFQHDLVALRGELRALLAVYHAQAFEVLTAETP